MRFFATAVVLAGAAAGVGYALGGSTPQTISGCYDKTNGNLRIATDCRTNELAISWNSAGAPGPTGSQGATGQRGPTGTFTSGPPNAFVDCTAGQTVSGALAGAPPFGSFDITIKGTCVESVHLQRDNVGLHAFSPGDGIASPGSQPALQVTGRNEFLQGLTINGGLVAFSGGQFNADQLTINAAQGGNAVNIGDGSRGFVSNSSISGGRFGAAAAGHGGSLSLASTTVVGDAASGGDGVVAQTGGSINVTDSDVSGARHGVVAYPGGSAEVNRTAIHDNNNTGLFAFGGGIHASQGSVTGSTFSGVSAYPGGVVVLSSGMDIAHNAVGVDSSGGRVLIQGGTIVESNRQDGVVASNASSVTVEDGTIRNNAGRGVTIRDNSVASFSPSDVITGNGGWGIWCDGPPSNPLMVGATPAVSGNGAGDVHCQHA